MITRQDALKQMLRLSVLGGWRDLPEAGQEELVEQIQAIFRDEGHAAAALTRWMRSSSWLPTPADLQRVADEVPPRAIVADRDCQGCRGTGFRLIWELITYGSVIRLSGERQRTVERITQEQYWDLRGRVDGHDQVVRECVEPCDCDYGQRLRAARLAQKAQAELDAHMTTTTRRRAS